MLTNLSDRYASAFTIAFKLHQEQSRKGSQIPYIAHLISVSAIVLENGGSENQAIAALLHDAVEDQGGRPTLQIIRDSFGDDVARIIEGCTDAFTDPKPPWKERKIDYLEKLKTAPDEILLVSLADKLHNARSILQDLLTEGDALWEKFNGKKAGTLWYYQSLANIFDSSSFPSLSNELRHLVEEIITVSNLLESAV
ncbi:MAG: HD domain-containing protein [Anaerolineales bacterium]|nr:HD domain-containing protein [Anaerolineales bacterium]